MTEDDRPDVPASDSLPPDPPAPQPESPQREPSPPEPQRSPPEYREIDASESIGEAKAIGGSEGGEIPPPPGEE